MGQFDDLDEVPRGYLEQSEQLADHMSDQAQQLAHIPRPETGNAELNSVLDGYLSQLGGYMQDSAHRTRANNRHVADLARAEQAESSYEQREEGSS